jgi:hypothetical protein
MNSAGGGGAAAAAADEDDDTDDLSLEYSLRQSHANSLARRKSIAV